MLGPLCGRGRDRSVLAAPASLTDLPRFHVGVRGVRLTLGLPLSRFDGTLSRVENTYNVSVHAPERRRCYR